MERSLIKLADGVFVAPGARLLGDVRLGPETSVFPGTTLRGEADYIELEVRANVQDNCLIEATPGYPVVIGARVSVGHNARIYGAIISEAALIAIGSTVHEGARIGTHAIVAANATIPDGMVVPPGKLVIGNGRILRDVTDAERERIERGAREYARLANEYLATARREGHPLEA